jgi:hypothetical protein
MSNSQCATEPELADPSFVQSASEDAPKLLKSVLIGFAATVTVGLALASWYVGVRIVDAKEAAPVSPAIDIPANGSSSQPAPALEPPAAAPSIQAAATVAPPPQPDLYLQVAGLGPRKDASFVKGLQAKGYRARVIESASESSADQEDSQILIGPFAGPRSLERAKRKLQAAGVLALETAY